MLHQKVAVNRLFTVALSFIGCYEAAITNWLGHMKRIILATALVVSCATGALAWDTTPTATVGNVNSASNASVKNRNTSVNANTNTNINHNSSHSSSNATSGSISGATSRSTATGGSVGGVNINAGNGGSGGGGVYVTVPDGRGEAPCGGGISLGGVGLGGGGSGGGSLWEFADCKRMREADFLYKMGFQQAAVNEMCQIDRVKQAFGGQCPIIPTVPMSYGVITDPPDYCLTRNAGDRNQHKECRVREHGP